MYVSFLVTVVIFYFFLLDKCLFNVSKDVLYVCAYVHPEGSPYYAYFDIDNGINLLKECLVDNILSLDDVFCVSMW